MSLRSANMDVDLDLRLLGELVGIDTDASKSFNYDEMASLLKEKIENIGGKVDVIYAKAPDGKSRPNVIGRLDFGAEKTIALNAHYDVVPVDRTDWKRDPFKLTRVGNRMYGRGASDDKSGIAVSLFAAENAKPTANVELVFTCDEEIGSKYGLAWVLEKHRKMIRADYAVVLDVEDCIVTGSSGVSGGTIIIKGVEHHAGMPFLGVNAVEKSLRFLLKLKKFDDVVSKYKCKYPGEMDGQVKGRFNITMINGGVAPNLIPGKVEIKFDLRSPPGTKVRDFQIMLINYFEKLKKEEKIDASIKMDSTHESYITDMDSDILKRIRKSVKEKKIHVSFGGFDGTFFSQANIPSVAYGAQNFSIHQANEYVEINKLRKVEKEMINLLESF